jgi:hypothetical protein
VENVYRRYPLPAFIFDPSYPSWGGEPVIITFPSFPPGLELRLSAVVLAAQANRGFFDSPECPYSDELKGFLKKIVAETRFDDRKEKKKDTDKEELAENADKFDRMLREVETTIADMADLEDKMEEADTGDRIQFVKAKTSLIEKWINIKERIYSVREIAEFQSTIIEVMDMVLSKDQRHQFIERLRTLRTTEQAAVRLEEDV